MCVKSDGEMEEEKQGLKMYKGEEEEEGHERDREREER